MMNTVSKEKTLYRGKMSFKSIKKFCDEVAPKDKPR
jgi:hypothetical protein